MRAFCAAVIGSVAGLFMSVESTTGDACAFGFIAFLVCLLIFYGLFGGLDLGDW